MGQRAEEPQHWELSDTIDLTDEAEVRKWAVRLFVTPSELREMVEEIADRPSRRHRFEPLEDQPRS